MSTGVARAPQHLIPARPPRVAARHRLAVPLSVTVLRSGVPDAVPGRSVDVCEGGVGAVLAAELFPGELVGVEFELPHTGPVLAKARVCYHEKLRYGLQFLSIPPEQREMIGKWTRGALPVADAPKKPEAHPVTPVRSQANAPKIPTRTTQRPSAVPRFASLRPSSAHDTRRKVSMMLIASVVVAVGLGWWRWEQAWQKLEAHMPGHTVATAQPLVKVPAETMQRLLIHKVDPIYSESSSKHRATGVVVLDATVGTDGAVASLRPISGPDALARVAMDSVQWWKFEPYRQNNEPVAVETTIAIEFR